MKPESIFRLTKTALVATAFLSASFAFAGPSPASPEMKAALAKAQEGPTELRRFVQRTKPIYQLDYYEVMSLQEQQRAVARAEAPTIARAAAE
jgi:hypothetical protein